MQSNLPPGCSESDIPGNRPEDKATDMAVEEKQCVACKHYGNTLYDEPCGDCSLGGSEHFEEVEDLAVVEERIIAELEAKEDGHNDD